MAVPYSIGKKLVLSLKDSKLVVSMLTDQSRSCTRRIRTGTTTKLIK